MPQGYFHRVMRQTPTRLWINNPSAQDAKLSIEAGALGCTTNPSYCSKLLESEADYLRGVIDQVIKTTEDDDEAADKVYQIATERIMRLFYPIWKSSGGQDGYVTMQGDPRRDFDPDHIVKEAMEYRRLGENFMAKIPMTEHGVKALEVLVPRGIPVCATEIFSVSQAVCVCEEYQRVAKKSGQHPPFYFTHITGIFDQYVEGIVKAERIDISPEVLKQAGCAIAREEYRIFKERGYEGVMLGGGARGNHHFTEMVGVDMYVTINWSMAADILKRDLPIVNRIEARAAPEVLQELRQKLPNFRRAFDEGALSLREFTDFGPVVLFRTMFLNGWVRLLDEIRARRHQGDYA